MNIADLVTVSSSNPIVEILTPDEEINAQMERIEMAGRTCYWSEKEEVTIESAEKFIRMLIKRGHLSVIEHLVITVKFVGVSRGFTHEAVRHRLTSVSQRSTRYVDYQRILERLADGDEIEGLRVLFVIPPNRNPNEEIIRTDGKKLSVEDMFVESALNYHALRDAGWPAEDARQILPIGVETEIVITANIREWMHIFSVRTAKDAHWEIRLAMCKLLEMLKEKIPVIFESFVPGDGEYRGAPYYIRQTG